MNNKTISIGVGLLVLLVGAYYVMNMQKEADLMMKESGSGVKTEAPAGTVNEETGEVDQEMFEEKQQVSEDDSLDTIEAELDSTVILEEDFSDL